MADAVGYGSWVGGDDWRAHVEANVNNSYSNTQAQVTVACKVDSLYGTTAGYANIQGQAFCGSQSSSTATTSISTNQTKDIVVARFLVNKTHSAQTVTVKAVVKGISGTYSGSSSTATATVTVSAKEHWSVTYSGGSGASNVPSTQVKWANETLTLSSTKPTRTGYTFKRWVSSGRTDGTAYFQPGSTTAYNGAQSLVAEWTANTYAVTYNANGGSGAPASQTKTYGVTLTLSSTKPTRAGYTFLGWSTSSTATSATYQAGGSYTNNAAAALYAVWKVAYAAPTITGLVATRSDGETDSDEGTQMRVAFSWAVDSTDSGTVSAITIKHKPKTGTSWTSTSVSASGTSGTVNTILSGPFDASTTYDVQVVVADSHNLSTTRSTFLSPAAFILEVLEGGNGLSIGKACTENGLHVAWDAEFDGNVYLATNNSMLLGIDVDGETLANLVMLNSNGNILVGSTANSGNTRIYGNNVDLVTGNKVRIDASSLITTQTFSATIGSTAAGTNATGSFSIAKSGYTPIATEWWWSAGTRQNFFNDYGSHFEGNTYYYRFCNVGSSAANGTLQVRVVYAKNEIL